MSDLVELFEKLGINLKWVIPVLIIALAVAALDLLRKFIKFVVSQRNKILANKNLHPYFSVADVEKATRYYIPTKYQNVSPAEDEEPGKGYIASAKNKIIPLFLKLVFKDSGKDNKYYLILADTGMGKTTFLINLYLRYKNQWSELLDFGRNQNIVLFPLGSPEALDAIRGVENKKNTILLLDAFDEDVKAAEDHRARMSDILHLAKDFKAIVITCRTQFFPSEEEIPKEAGYIKAYGDGQTEYKFQKLYLSVFNDNDIKKYLNKCYFYFSRRRKKAIEILQKSPNLVMRPMLLSHINDLVDNNTNFNYSFQVYEALIEKWIDRESKKNAIRKKYEDNEKYKRLLYDFSQSLAINLYEKRRERNGYFITKNEKLVSTLQLTEFENYTDSEKELRSKSLLNRNAQGQYKFSHKSILEYFLAKKMIEDNSFSSTFDFDGMSAAKNFYYEMLVEKLCHLDGVFATSASVSQPLSRLTVNELKDIRSLKIKRLNGFSPLQLLALTTLGELVIFDMNKCVILYDLYLMTWLTFTAPELRTMLTLPEQLEQLIPRDLKELRELRKRVARSELLIHRELQELQKRLLWLERLEQLARLDKPKQREFRNLLEWLRQLEWLEQQEFIERLKRLEFLELMSKITDAELLETLRPINHFLKEMIVLQGKLNKCKIYY